MTRKFVIADQNAISAEGHFKTYTNALACAAQALACDVTVLWNKRFPIDSLPANYAMRPVFSFTEGEAAARGLQGYGEGHFGFELETALGPLSLGAGDHVVVHTCHFVELVEALDYLATLPPASELPDFHIVVRYDPEVYRYRMHHLMRRLGAIARTPLLREKLHLHSDTQQLARTFTALFGIPVGVCPIPVDLDRLLSAETHASKPASPRPLIATYLGTARSEKGYRDILDALVFLKKDYLDTDRLHFVLQCSTQSIASEPGLAEYQRDLESFILANDLMEKVRLVRHVVEQEEYCALVAESDIALLAYSPASYRYRSSSVLIEAMATGKVIVTRAGSWMASCVSADNAICYDKPEDLGPALAEAVKRYDELQASARARQAAAIIAANPETLARYFLVCGERIVRADCPPALLMIGRGDEIARADLGAPVFLSRLASFVDVGYRVQVLLFATQATNDFDARRRCADALRPFPLDAVYFLEAADIGNAKKTPVETPAAIYLSACVDPAIVAQLGFAGTPVLPETTLLQICPLTLRPSRITDLAGPVDGFELVASCDPLHRPFRIDDRMVAKADERYQKLAQLTSLDILLLVSESGVMRWFYDAVYRPFLADRAVTVVVVGDTGATATADAFICVGPVGDCDPLYAAAKLIVVVDGERTPVLLTDVLARGKPTFFFGDTTYHPARKGPHGQEDVRGLVDEIIDLLDSAPRRAIAAQRSLDLARRPGAADACEAIAAQLSEQGALPPRACHREMAPAVAETETVEWGPAIIAANRFVRRRLDNEPFESLRPLADAEGGGRALVARIARALIDDDGAPILRVDGCLMTRVLQQRMAGGAAEIVRLADIAIGTAHDFGVSSALIVNRRFPTEIGVEGSACADEPPPVFASAPFEPASGAAGACVWRLCGQHDENAEYLSIRLSRDSPSKKITLRQDIPLREDARVYGRNVFMNWSFDDGKPVVRQEPQTRNDLSRVSHAILSRFRSFLLSWAPWARANQLFDTGWYVGAYPEAADAAIEPFRHYERYGIAKGYRPNPFFDADWYARRYGLSVSGAWRHYLENGHDPRFDPGPLFSAARYLHENPDVAGTWRWSPLLHYVLMGQREGREIHPAEPQRPHQSLALPVAIARDGFAWVEFVLDMACDSVRPFALHGPEGLLDLETRIEDGALVARAILPPSAMTFGLVCLNVTRPSGAPPVEIRALRTGWSVGD